VNIFSSITDWWTQQAASLQVFWSIGFCGLLLIAMQGLLSIFLGHHDVNVGSHEYSWNGYLSLKTLSGMFLGVGFGGVIFGQNGFSVAFALSGGILIGLFRLLFCPYERALSPPFRWHSDVVGGDRTTRYRLYAYTGA
jgi:hypothetical protein